MLGSGGLNMKIVDYLFKKTCWHVAFRRLDNDGESFSSFDKDYTIIKLPKRYWIADPFLLRHDNKTFLFCEMMDRKVSHGKIGYAELSECVGETVRKLS